MVRKLKSKNAIWEININIPVLIKEVNYYKKVGTLEEPLSIIINDAKEQVEFFIRYLYEENTTKKKP